MLTPSLRGGLDAMWLSLLSLAFWGFLTLLALVRASATIARRIIIPIQDNSTLPEFAYDKQPDGAAGNAYTAPKDIEVPWGRATECTHRSQAPASYAAPPTYQAPPLEERAVVASPPVITGPPASTQGIDGTFVTVEGMNGTPAVHLPPAVGTVAEAHAAVDAELARNASFDRPPPDTTHVREEAGVPDTVPPPPAATEVGGPWNGEQGRAAEGDDQLAPKDLPNVAGSP